MRYKSTKQNGYILYAVAGTDVVSFGIDFKDADTQGLLGFAVERHDRTENEKYFLKGFKVFREIFPDPKENVLVSTNEHPVQSFVWDDLTVKPTHTYEYFFYPIKGQPKFLDRKQPVCINVVTEDLYTTQEHDVFFNRGVASSQEYARRFSNQPPDEIADPVKKAEAFEWLSRNLDEAFYKFIDRAQHGDSLFGCFYEFHYLPALKKFKDAIDRGVDVNLIVDCKINEYTDKDGTFHESFPREENLRALIQAGINKKHIIQRTANKSAISHNKFLLYKPQHEISPTELWTGSTNISEGGIFGQTNLGHWVRNKNIAALFKGYWDLLSGDPGIKEDSVHPVTENREFKSNVQGMSDDVTLQDIHNANENVLPVFSPRPDLTVLDTYFELVDQASESAFITLAFGVNKALKDKLMNNNFNSQIVFMLLEKRDAPAANSKNKDTFVRLNASHNVYQAYGSYISDPLYKWAKETSTLQLKLNTHVKYIHTKFLLHDPLSANPLIVTGSANFSEASTKDNDENMLIIKNDQRAADIYFTEFNRLFNHYYYRSVLLDLKYSGKTLSEDSLFLVSDDSWLDKYKPGKLRLKRLDIVRKMTGAITL
jgi:phosphatidylserine/phosphatidylglycerophosphate/cardiolipin synthase-like enzyme